MGKLSGYSRLRSGDPETLGRKTSGFCRGLSSFLFDFLISKTYTKTISGLNLTLIPKGLGTSTHSIQSIGVKLSQSLWYFMLS